MRESKVHKLQAAGIDPAYLDELYDNLVTKWERKAEAARHRRQKWQ